MSTELRDNPVFICGHPKSGTSLLRSLLDTHPQLITYPEETVFFRRYLPKVTGKTLEEKILLSDRYLTHMFDWNRESPTENQKGFTDRDYSHIPAGEIRSELRKILAGGIRHNGDVLSAAMLAYGKVAGQRSENSLHWVEKTPYNERFADQIFNWWQDARCIHMVRDPRDNYVSYRRKHPEWTPSVFSLSWRRSALAGLSNQKKYGPERYLIIRFEDFTSAPDAIIAKLCKFLGIDDDPALRAPTRGGRSWAGNSMFADRFQGISSAPIGRWTETIKPDEQYIIEKLTAKPMKILNYPLSKETAERIPIQTRLRTLFLSTLNPDQGE